MELRSLSPVLGGPLEDEQTGMTRTATDSRQALQPKAVVVAAHRAANGGRYTTADSYLAPSFTQGLQRTARLSQPAAERIRRFLELLRGRRDAEAVRRRRVLRALLEAHRELAKLDIGSPRFRRGMWNEVTRQRSLLAVEAIRQVIRKRRARVYLKLTLADGSVVSDSEPLVLVRGRWLMG